jgi:hypothetical protein
VSATFSQCGLYRLRLDRSVADSGPLYGLAGINPSKAGDDEDDQTTKKLIEFVRRWGGRGYALVNPFGFISTDVRRLTTITDPIGPGNMDHVRSMIAEADILIPMWGDRKKVPSSLHMQIGRVLKLMLESGKPVKTFGRTKGGDPMHPLMLAYSTQLQDWMP